MIGTWVALLNKQEQEIMAEEEERIRKLGTQGAFDYGYSSKMDQQMLQEMMQADNKQYAAVLDNIPKGAYIYPELILSKIRLENPKLNGAPIPPPNGENEPVDMTGKYKWTLKNFIEGQPYCCSGYAPIKSYSGAKDRLLNYPEFWVVFKLSFSQIMVPILKYIESCGWVFNITSSLRRKEKSYNWTPWISLQNFRNCGASDHDKACAFDLSPDDSSKKNPSSRLPKKVVTAILYKKILLQQIPNLPTNNTWARQVLVEHTIGSGPFGTSGWVHLAAARYENDVSVNYQFAFMGQIKGGGQTGKTYLSPAPNSRSGKLINVNNVAKVDGEFKNGLSSFFAATAGYNWNYAPADKQWWMNKVRAT